MVITSCRALFEKLLNKNPEFSVHEARKNSSIAHTPLSYSMSHLGPLFNTIKLDVYTCTDAPLFEITKAHPTYVTWCEEVTGGVVVK